MVSLRPFIRPAWSLGTWLGSSEHTVVLTGSPRSGTSWLLEMIERATGARRIWEPFFQQQQPVDERNFGLGSRPYLRPATDRTDLECRLANLFTGHGVSPGSATGANPYGRVEMGRRLSCAPATVVKFCRAQRLLPWLLDRFHIPAVLLIRHPLAVVSSQLEHPSWSHDRVEDTHPIMCDRIRRDYPELAAWSEQLDRPEERLAATWTFDYLVSLANWSKIEGLMLVTYESLVQAPVEALTEILAHLGLSGDAAKSDSRLPSASTRTSSNVAQGRDPLATWRRRLDEGQIRRILAVIERFGFEIYDRALVARPSHLPDERAVRTGLDRAALYHDSDG